MNKSATPARTPALAALHGATQPHCAGARPWLRTRARRLPAWVSVLGASVGVCEASPDTGAAGHRRAARAGLAGSRRGRPGAAVWRSVLCLGMSAHGGPAAFPWRPRARPGNRGRGSLRRLALGAARFGRGWSGPGMDGPSPMRPRSAPGAEGLSPGAAGSWRDAGASGPRRRSGAAAVGPGAGAASPRETADERSPGGAASTLAEGRRAPTAPTRASRPARPPRGHEQRDALPPGKGTAGLGLGLGPSAGAGAVRPQHQHPCIPARRVPGRLASASPGGPRRSSSGATPRLERSWRLGHGPADVDWA